MLHSGIVVFFILAIIVIGLAIAFKKKTNYNKAPRKIWTYWDSSDTAVNKIPKTVQLCLESWKKHNPEYEITLLTKKNYFSYVTIPTDIATHPNFNDNPSRFSELVRLYALTEHGGIWIDASVLLKKPLDDWLFPKYAEFSGFYRETFTKEAPSPNKNGFSPVIENWFIACNKGCPFVKLWLNEFLEMARFPNVEKYIQSKKDMDIDFEKIYSPIDYAQLIAAQKILQLDKYSIESFILRKSEEGPLKYLVDAKWDSEKALRLVCGDTNLQSPLIKIRENERKIMEQQIDFDLSPEKCGWLI